MQGKEKEFSDKWILIIGIPVIGLTFPFLFGLRFGDPKFLGWIIISMSTTVVTWFSNRAITSLIWIKFPWEKSPALHILLSLISIPFFSLICSGVIFGLHHLFFHTGWAYWTEMRPIRVGVVLLIIFLVMLHEAIFLFYKWKTELTHAADLEKENMRSRLDALKNHVNPHFLFNSLGTLASLIPADPAKAEKYVGEFARIYRYFLEVNNNDLVTLKEELDFIHSYVFLQQIRLGDGFSFHDRVEKPFHSWFILPLTLELLVENALKHNTTMPSSPLQIEVYITKDGDSLVVRNNFQPRHTPETTGTGLVNLEQRYAGYLGRHIHCRTEGSFYIAEIPMIPPEP